jgi:hypothetical protein
MACGRTPVAAPAFLRGKQREDLRTQLKIVTRLAERLLEDRRASRNLVIDPT